MAKEKGSTRLPTRLTYKSFIPAQGRQPTLSSSDSQANTRNDSSSWSPLPILWKQKRSRRAAQNGFLLKGCARFSFARDESKVPVSSQSLSLARKVFRVS